MERGPWSQWLSLILTNSRCWYYARKLLNNGAIRGGGATVHIRMMKIRVKMRHLFALIEVLGAAHIELRRMQVRSR